MKAKHTSSVWSVAVWKSNLHKVCAPHRWEWTVVLSLKNEESKHVSMEHTINSEVVWKASEKKYQNLFNAVCRPGQDIVSIWHFSPTCFQSSRIAKEQLWFAALSYSWTSTQDTLRTCWQQEDVTPHVGSTQHDGWLTGNEAKGRVF